MFVAACTSPQVAHKEPNPVYRLNGAHYGLPCASCHGTPTRLSTSCIECHSDEVAPSHHPGQECSVCHDEVAWSNLGTETDTDTDADSDTDTDTDSDTEPTGFDHSSLPADQLCAECHEDDRKPDGHYLDPTPWDCSTCHRDVFPHFAPENAPSADCIACHRYGQR